MLKATQIEPNRQNGVDNLKSEVEYRTRLQDIGNRINAARDLDEILIDLQDDITALFSAERVTMYVIDGVKRELVSRFKSGEEIAEIRLPVSKESLAGYAALTHKLLNIENVYDDEELSSIDEGLSFDKSWDQKTGYRTREMLVYPIIFQKYLMGALQLVNRIGGRMKKALPICPRFSASPFTIKNAWLRAAGVFLNSITCSKTIC